MLLYCMQIKQAVSLVFLDTYGNDKSHYLHQKVDVVIINSGVLTTCRRWICVMSLMTNFNWVGIRWIGVCWFKFGTLYKY